MTRISHHFGERLGQRIGASAAKCDRRASFRCLDRQRPSDAGARAGDQRALTLKLHGF
jgi:hypothetical protein